MTRARQHPTGLTAMAATVLVWFLGELGVEMPPEVAASIVGLASVAVSAWTPRKRS